MVQARTLDFNAARSAVNVNKSKLNLLAPGLYSGYNVVIDSGTVGAGDTIEINSAPDVTSNLMTVEGVRVEENADPIATLGIATADGSNPRVDIVVAQHTHDQNNNPATYAVVTGTPAASPVPPATPIDAVVLAEVFVATSAGSITNDNIVRRAKELASLDDEDTSRSTNLENTTHAPVADITALKAIAPEERADNQTLLVKDDGTAVAALYRFDSASTDTADGLTIVIPNAFSLGTAGRWFRLPVADAFDLAGMFVAKIGGSSPDYAGTAIRTALSDFENSGQEAALFIVRENMDFSGGNLTVSKPFKMVGQARPGSSRYTLAFDGTDVLTLDPETLSLAGFIEAEFVGIDINRGTGGTGGILFPETSSLRLRFSRIVDQATAGSVDFIRFTGNGFIELETSILAPATNQSLISGTFVTVICRKCTITDTTGEIFNVATVELHLRDETLYRADDFTNVTTLRVWMDGTSLLVGITQIPAGFTNLELSGKDLWTSSIGGVTLSDAVNFNLSGHLQLPTAVVALGASELIISRSNLVVSGTKSGSSGTRIEGSPSAVGNKLVELAGDNIRLEGIIFRCSPAVSSHAVGIVQFDVGTETGHEIIDCEFQAEGAEDTGVAVSLGGTNGSGSVIRDCLVRSSPDGTPAFFRGTNTLIIQGEGRIESCTVKNFLDVGIRSIGQSRGGVRVIDCLADMSSCTGAAIGIKVTKTVLSNCQVHCFDLGSALDTAQAIEDGGSVAMSHCQISGLGTASTRRIGIGIGVTSTLSKISGCTIIDFRIHGIKIEGDLNVVVHNIITSIDDGAAGGIAIEALSGADNNLVDTNLETGTGGTPYVDGGATNDFDVASSASRTVNKSV